MRTVSHAAITALPTTAIGRSTLPSSRLPTATCNSCAVTGGNDSYNTCSPFGCAGKYDNAAHGVPNPLPTP